MLRFARWSIVILLSLVAGTALGPVVIAAGAAAMTTEDSGMLEDEAAKLVDAYRDQLPVHVLFLSITPPPDGEECGYDPETIFPDFYRHGRADTDYLGYDALHQWRINRIDEAWIDAITTSIRDRMSPFQIGFLRSCIETTLFADRCAREVERFGDTVPRYFHLRVAEGVGFENRVVCSFVDGIAARRRVPLVSRDLTSIDD